MTRKTALQKALELLQQITETEEINQVKAKISEIIDDLPITSWSVEAIFDTLDQFVLEHASNPTTTDLKARGMPDHPVIMNRFSITAKEFLAQYYPKSCHLVKYCNHTKEEWQQFFIDTLTSLDQQTSDNYNKKRDRNTPVWQSIARMHNFRVWSEWLIYCGITPRKNSPTKRLNTPPHHKEFRVHKNTQLFDGLSPQLFTR